MLVAIVNVQLLSFGFQVLCFWLRISILTALFECLAERVGCLPKKHKMCLLLCRHPHPQSLTIT
jgi:hypothetical protein